MMPHAFASWRGRRTGEFLLLFIMFLTIKRELSTSFQNPLDRPAPGRPSSSRAHDLSSVSESALCSQGSLIFLRRRGRTQHSQIAREVKKPATRGIIAAIGYPLPSLG